MRSDVAPVFEEILGACTIERSSEDDPRKPASLVVRTAEEVDHASLLAKLGAP